MSFDVGLVCLDPKYHDQDNSETDLVTWIVLFAFVGQQYFITNAFKVQYISGLLLRKKICILLNININPCIKS